MASVAAASIGRRERVLRALGVVPYGLRGRFRPVIASPVNEAAADVAPGATTCVLIVPDAASARVRTLLDHAVQALGSRFACVGFLEVAAGKLAGPLPRADVALVFGDTQAQAMESAMQDGSVSRIEVVTLDSPGALLQADGKRRLWQAVSRLRRRVLAG